MQSFTARVALLTASAITITHISRVFTYKMAAKINWHRHETKLRHCHRILFTTTHGSSVSILIAQDTVDCSIALGNNVTSLTYLLLLVRSERRGAGRSSSTPDAASCQRRVVGRRWRPRPRRFVERLGTQPHPRLQAEVWAGQWPLLRLFSADQCSLVRALDLRLRRSQVRFAAVSLPITLDDAFNRPLRK